MLKRLKEWWHRRKQDKLAQTEQTAQVYRIAGRSLITRVERAERIKEWR